MPLIIYMTLCDDLHEGVVILSCGGEYRHCSGYYYTTLNLVLLSTCTSATMAINRTNNTQHRELITVHISNSLNILKICILLHLFHFEVVVGFTLPLPLH